MSKLIQGILGPAKGKVGNVVAASWKGINYVRGYAIPANPQSTAQTAQRNKMSFLVSIAKLVLTTVLQPVWDPFVSTMSGFNSFIKSNIVLISGADDFASMIMAKGSLESEEIDSCAYDSTAGTISCVWVPSGLGNGEDTDSAVLVVIDTDNDVAFVSSGDTRSDEQIDLTIGADRTAANLKSFLYFHSGTGSDLAVSNSDYHQVTAV